MKAELWLNRADHELALAQELLNAGSFLWAVSYAHRALEYTFEGLLVMKTGVRPERGTLLCDLHHAARSYLPDTIHQPVTDLSDLTTLVWQSDLSADQIKGLTESRARELITGAKKVLSWVGEEWEKDQSETPVTPEE